LERELSRLWAKIMAANSWIPSCAKYCARDFTFTAFASHWGSVKLVLLLLFYKYGNRG
jgi:hypothetical protein